MGNSDEPAIVKRKVAQLKLNSINDRSRANTGGARHLYGIRGAIVGQSFPTGDRWRAGGVHTIHVLAMVSLIQTRSARAVCICNFREACIPSVHFEQK